MEEVLEFKNVPTDRHVPLVATHFCGRAAAWWYQLKSSRSHRGKPKIETWEKFTKHLKSEFLPFNYTRTLYQKLQNLRQGTRSIDAYTDEFYQLLARIDLNESDEQLISRYIGGLRVPFQDILNMLPVSISGAHQHAVAYESQSTRRAPLPFAAVPGRFSASSSFTALSSTLYPPFSPLHSRAPSPLVPSEQRRTVGKSPPLFSPRAMAPSQPLPARGPCFSCGELGQRMSQCPKSGGTRCLLVEDDDSACHIEPFYDTYGEESFPELFVEGIQVQIWWCVELA